MTRRIILCVFFLVSVHAADAQCRLYSKKDDFTGAVAYWTKPVKIASDGVGIVASQFDCRYKISMHFVYGNNKAVLVLTESGKMCGGCAPASVTFKLANDTVITKANLRQGAERSQGFGESEQFSFFDLTNDEVALLATQQIAKFRIKELYCTDHSTVETEMNDKAAGHVREDAACIQTKLQQHTSGR